VTDLFEEVEEQIRQDRYVTFFKKYGLWLAAGFALIIAGMSAGLAWRHYDTKADRARSEAFSAIQDLRSQGQLDQAKAALETFEGRNDGVYRALVPMLEGAILVDQGDLQGALAAYDRAAAAAKDPLVRDSARLRAAYIVADTQDFAAVEQRVTPLLETAGPLRAMARELLAIEAWEAGDTERARGLFDEIALDLNSPDDVRQRAEAMGPAVLGPAPEAPAADAPATPAAAAPAAAPVSTPAQGAAQ
jgi:hypothetical protein